MSNNLYTTDSPVIIDSADRQTDRCAVYTLKNEIVLIANGCVGKGAV